MRYRRDDDKDNVRGQVPTKAEHTSKKRNDTGKVEKLCRESASCWNAFVARDVSRKELRNEPKAIAAQDEEWGRLWAQKVWSDEVVMNRDVLAQ